MIFIAVTLLAVYTMLAGYDTIALAGYLAYVLGMESMKR